VKIVGPDFIDYWQPTGGILDGQKSRFGIRLRQGRCWPLVQVGDEPACSFGSAQELPVEISSLPDYMRIVVEEDRASDQTSDLLDVLVGKKTFKQALRSPEKSETSDGATTETVLVRHAQ